MATYVNDLRLKEIATGDEAGTWGTSTNTNLELIAEAMGHGAEAVANASTHTITMADGATDQFRSTFLRLTGGGQACTVTLAPNTLSHTWIMRNETAAALTLTQGTGANVVIAAGQTKIVATDGAGSGAIVYEMDDLELAGNLTVTGVLDVDGTANLDVVDIDGAVDMASTLTVAGKITADAGIDIDNINIDGTTIALSSGDLTLDVAGDIILDFDGGDLRFKDGGTEIGLITSDGSNLGIFSRVSDKDIIFYGNDGGSTITALTLDMSDAGAATFNGGIAIDGRNASTPGLAEKSDLNTGLFWPAADSLAVTTAGTERVRVDASGNMTVNRSSVFTTAKMEIQSDASDALTLALNSIDTDGSILQFYKAGTALGSAGTTTSAGGTRFAIGAVGDPGIIFAGTGVFPATQITASDNSADLGSGNYRWKDIFLSGGAFLGGTAAPNKLEDYEEGTWTPTDASGASLSLTVISASYTKIGRLVYVTAYIEYPATSSTASQLNGGLPFTSMSGSTFPQLTARVINDVVSTQNLTFQITTNTTEGGILDGASRIDNAELSSRQYLFSGSYQTP